jgi:PAS domain S-box-containing protein
MNNAQANDYALFDHVYKLAPIGIAFVSPDGTWMKVNPTLCSMLGYTKEELLELTFRDVTHPCDMDENNVYVNDMLMGKTSSYELEKRYIQKNGNIVWASLHANIVRDELQDTPLYFIAHIIDISEKKAGELKLLEIEKMYKMISENARDIISYTSPDGIIRYCSPSVRDLLGYEPEEIIGNNSLDLYHSDDCDKLKMMTFADNDVFSIRLRHKNGHFIWLEISFKTTRDEEGNMLSTLSIGRDISDRKRNEENLAEAQRIALLGSWEWDILNEHVFFSDQVYRVYDMDPKLKLVTPREALQLLHGNSQHELIEGIKQAFHSGSFNMEFPHTHADGSIKFLNLRGVVSYDEHGIPSRMNGTVQDITERKMFESKLQESIERYTSLKKYNHDAVISLDLQGNIINANNMAQKLTGYQIQEMAGESLSRLIGTDNLQRILTEPVDDLSTEKNIDKIYHKDGHTVEVLTTIAPIIITGNIVGYYVIAKDITEEKKLLLAKEAAERTNKTKSEFLAMMSHEIRTPMNGVIGMTDLLMESTDLNSEQREYVEIIRKSGSSLLSIINDILDFSKIESGKTDLQEGPLNVRQCIAETVDILSSKAISKHLTITSFVSPDIPEQLKGDSERLKQVLRNLIGNSIKFTESGGVTIKVNKLSQKPCSLQLEFVVEDTGIGIPLEHRGQLFEPFYQLDHFMTRQHEGTGLGLAICKRLVSLMDGQIWIKSEEGPGLTVVFTASFTNENPEQSSPCNETGKEDWTAHSLNILVAEDNEINQLVIKKILEKQGHVVRVVGSGNEVVSAVTYEPFDIVFMDVQMPGMSGLEATQMIKNNTSEEKCPIIIAVTANALQGDREKCLEAGMDEYLSKPIRSETVTEMIGNFFPQTTRFE